MKRKTPVFKLVLIGDSAVGKSSIIQNYISQKFSFKYDTTVGTDFISKLVKIDENLSITLQIWDTAGQECFRSLIKSFYQNTTAFFIVYDITNSETFENVNVWLNEISENCPNDPIKVLVGNKSDLPNREISIQKAQTLMLERKIDLFFETSALKGDKVDHAFNETAKLIILKQLKDEFLVDKKNSIEIIEKKVEVKELTASNRISVKLEKQEVNIKEIKKSGCC